LPVLHAEMRAVRPPEASPRKSSPRPQGLLREGRGRQPDFPPPSTFPIQTRAQPPLLTLTKVVVIPAERPELAEPVGAPGRARRYPSLPRYPARWLGRHARSPKSSLAAEPGCSKQADVAERPQAPVRWICKIRCCQTSESAERPRFPESSR
jgi:hypothetical protein